MRPREREREKARRGEERRGEGRQKEDRRERVASASTFARQLEPGSQRKRALNLHARHDGRRRQALLRSPISRCCFPPLAPQPPSNPPPHLLRSSPRYPGNLFTVVSYIPTDVKVVTFQITAVVEYVITELLALAGGLVERSKDQVEFKSKKREDYGDFPKIRPSDLKQAVQMDPELKNCIGSLFKV